MGSLYDFARSGATANNSIVPRQTQDVDTQTRFYLKSNVANETSKTLFLTWIGVNDIHDIFIDPILSDNEKQMNIRNVIQTLRAMMSRIYHHGEAYHAILGLIPIEQLPLFNSLTSLQRRELQGYVDMFNNQLRQSVTEFNAVTHGLHTYFIDLHKAYLDLYGDVPPPSEDCHGQSNCKDLLWWDEWHPTTKVHKALAEKTVEALSFWGVIENM
ncbi:carbohydrate esterase family 16 protein [Backusella circina FSU 941]|nr:carbohydrate esterase family 16 protein [Backusella circina FSU 941]